jgi:hypothetical protein
VGCMSAEKRESGSRRSRSSKGADSDHGQRSAASGHRSAVSTWVGRQAIVPSVQLRPGEEEGDSRGERVEGHGARCVGRDAWDRDKKHRGGRGQELSTQLTFIGRRPRFGHGGGSALSHAIRGSILTVGRSSALESVDVLLTGREV